jgi:hypothetical protein
VVVGFLYVTFFWLWFDRFFFTNVLDWLVAGVGNVEAR